MTIGLTASRTARAALVASGIALLLGAVGASGTAASRHVRAPQTCAPGTTYTHIRMSPQPIATFGSLQAGQTSGTFFVQPLNGPACVAGAVVYVSMTASVAGDSTNVVTPSECGGATHVTSTPLACTTDSTGKVNFTYTAASPVPDHGTAEMTAANHATGGGFSTKDWYLYEMLYKFSASPIAHSGTLSAGQNVVDTLNVTGPAGDPQVGAKVFLSLTSTASKSGTASVGSTQLTGTPKSFTADFNGQIQISYTAPNPLPTTGIDTITANGSASGTNLFNSTSYAFAASTPLVSVGDITQVEGDGHGPSEKGTNASFNITLSAPQSTSVTVQYITVCGVGDKGCKEDYLQTLEPTPRTITFTPGQVSQTVNVVYYSYVAPEPYTETMFVQLLNPSTGTVLGRSIGNGTILQDGTEASTALTLYVGDAGVVVSTSGNQFAIFTVVLSLPSTSVVTFTYATSNGSALSGTDYTATSGTGTIAVGITSAHIKVPILPKTGPGSTLNFTMTISASSGPGIDRATGTGSIINWN